MSVTRAQLATLYPRAIPDLLDGVAAAAPDVLARFGISANPDRLAYFLAQVGHESGGLTINVENMNYSARRLTEVWPRRFPTIAAAAPYANNPEKLANFTYGGRMGNGPPASGDGFRFRGRGLIQITGRDGYRSVASHAGLPLEANPDLVTVPANALLCAAAFWKWKDLNPVCDARDFTRCTIIINGGTVGIADRREWLDKARRVLAPPPPVQPARRTRHVRPAGAAARRLCGGWCRRWRYRAAHHRRDHGVSPVAGSATRADRCGVAGGAGDCAVAAATRPAQRQATRITAAPAHTCSRTGSAKKIQP
jgi:putative chitinase